MRRGVAPSVLKAGVGRENGEASVGKGHALLRIADDLSRTVEASEQLCSSTMHSRVGHIA